VERNFRLRSGEVDIIARQGDTLVFVEVKTRRSGRFGTPQEAVDGRKQRQIAQTALAFLAARGLEDCAVRFDVVAVYLDDQKSRIELIQNAFEYQNG
jgi:putative endonuclease